MLPNFGILQGIIGPQVVGQISGQQSAEDDGLGDLLSGLKGLIGTRTPSAAPPAQTYGANFQQPTLQETAVLSSITPDKSMANLNPEFQKILPQVLNDLKAQGFQPVIASGYRTKEEQAEKVKSGASKTMHSHHMTGDAVDIIDSRYGWNTKKYDKEIKQFANAMSQTAAKYKLGSGTGWKSFGPYGDFAHIQMQPINQSSSSRIPMSATPNQYIKDAQAGARNVYKDNPVMADIATAQAILESNLANKPSGLALKNNYFGIKGKGTAGSANMPTWEVINGKKINVKAPFAVNATPADSFTQHYNLMQKPRYQAVREAKTFEDAADALSKAGYATDPQYPKKLKQIYLKYLKDGGASNTPNTLPDSSLGGSKPFSLASITNFGNGMDYSTMPIIQPPEQAAPMPGQYSVPGRDDGGEPQIPWDTYVNNPRSQQASNRINWGLLSQLVRSA